ncbi:MAG: DUF4124 domain-containing protein [Gammaproteobacteria bacterium]|nr:DUF4124 domain-containing protein [Gammaproteobacteria bacterium]
MRLDFITVLTCLLLPLTAAAQQRPSYSWVDDEGITHFGDSIPAEYADKPKEVLNEHGVTVGHIQGKKTEEEIAAEKAAAELELQMELQRRADRALLSTYVNVAEIEMHRDRRVELFQAQARVTELYLRNLDRRLNQLKQEAGTYKPYNSDPNATSIDQDLLEDIDETESSIARHKENLKKFQSEERQIIERFEGDIQRFMILKGLTHAQTD